MKSLCLAGFDQSNSAIHRLLSDQEKKRKLSRPKYRCIADFDGKNRILLIFSPEMDVLAYFD